MLRAVVDLPLIGVTGSRGRASRVRGIPELLPDRTIDIHHSPYTSAIAAAGGTPVQISRDADPGDLLEHLDGVVLAGGDDVDPRLYGARPGTHTTLLDPARDAFELALIEGAVERSIPLLGICRGCQLINVARAGTLTEHLSLDEGEAHGQLAYPLDCRVHGLSIAPDQFLAHVLPPDVRVNSFHHQAIDRPGSDIVVLATAPDGIIEAIGLGTRVLGVQWHPEYLLEQPDPVFSWLVEEARCLPTPNSEENKSVNSEENKSVVGA